MQPALEQLVRDFAAETGTIHLLEDGVLVLKAQVGLPPPVALLVASVPIGKGMAGLAAQRNAPVSSCNIQTDTTGDVRPGALQTGANGAIVVPIRGADGQVRGTLGIAVRRPYEYSPEETDRLLARAQKLVQ